MASGASGRAPAAAVVIRSRRERARARSSARLRAIMVSQPATEPRAGVEPGGLTPGLGERIQHHLFGVRALAHDPVRHRVEHLAVAIVESGHGALVAARPPAPPGRGSAGSRGGELGIAQEVYTPPRDVHKQPPRRLGSSDRLAVVALGEQQRPRAARPAGPYHVHLVAEPFGEQQVRHPRADQRRPAAGPEPMITASSCRVSPSQRSSTGRSVPSRREKCPRT